MNVSIWFIPAVILIAAAFSLATDELFPASREVVWLLAGVVLYFAIIFYVIYKTWKFNRRLSGAADKSKTGAK